MAVERDNLSRLLKIYELSEGDEKKITTWIHSLKEKKKTLPLVLVGPCATGKSYLTNQFEKQFERQFSFKRITKAIWKDLVKGDEDKFVYILDMDDLSLSDKHLLGGLAETHLKRGLLIQSTSIPIGFTKDDVVKLHKIFK